MKAIIKIYQIEDTEDCVYAFCSYNKDVFDFKDYKEVSCFKYNESETIIEILHKIFELGKCGTLKQLIPTMRLVSVSDIIEVNGMRFYVDLLNDKIAFTAVEKVEEEA